MRRIGVLVAVLALLAACSTNRDEEPTTSAPPPSAAAVTPEQARAIAKEAYIYGFPIVDNYRVMYSYFVNKDNPEYKGGWNEVHNTARLYTPEDKAIQTPNSDTPYSALGADLRTEPLVLTVPPIEQNRYYSLQFVDLYTYNMAYVGSRTTGNGGGKYLLAGPNWKGEKPEGINEVIRSDTDLALVLYRTQLLGPSDIDQVKKIQAGYQATPLSVYLNQPAPPPAPPIDFVPPLTPEQERTSPQFFEILNFALRFAPALPDEQEMRARFATIGIGPEGDFESDKLAPEMRTAIEGGMADAWQEFDTFKKEKVDTGEVGSAQFFGTAQDLKGNYLYRMAGAVLGIYGNTAAEALYPGLSHDSTGAPLTGAEQLHRQVRLRAVAARERVLVADHVRVAAEPAGREPDPALPDQLADAAQSGAGLRRRLHDLRPERVTGNRQGVQLAACAEGPVPDGPAAVLAQARRTQRDVEGATGN